jgi:hypothetical protein
MRSTTPFSSSWRFFSIDRRVLSSSIDAAVRRRRSPTSMPIASSRPMISLSVRSASRRRWQSSSSAGVACWLTATRAHAVSSRLTALSGSWRPGM